MSTNIVAFAVDTRNAKGCQSALRCAFDRSMICRGQTVKLVYVKQDASPVLPPYGMSNEMSIRREPDVETTQVFLPYRCFCLLRQVECELVVLQHPDAAKALMEYATSDGVDNFLISGSQWRWLPWLLLLHTSNFVRRVRKSAPKFCNVYVVSKRKMSKVHSATCAAPSGAGSGRNPTPSLQQVAEEERSLRVATTPRRSNNDSIRSQVDFSLLEVQHSFVNSTSGRTSTESTFISFYNNLPKLQLQQHQRIFIKSKIETLHIKSLRQLTISSDPAVRDSAWEILQNMEDKEDMKRRLEQKLRQTMDMYNAARKRLALAKGTRYYLEQPASSVSPSPSPSPSYRTNIHEDGDEENLKNAVGILDELYESDDKENLFYFSKHFVASPFPAPPVDSLNAPPLFQSVTIMVSPD